MTLEEFRSLKVNDHILYQEGIFFICIKIVSIKKILNTYNHICYLDVIYTNQNRLIGQWKNVRLEWNKCDIGYYSLITDQKEIDKYYKLAVFQ